VGKDHINDLLAQNDAMGIRIYLGENVLDDGNVHIMPVLVAANSNTDDIIGIVIDDTWPCPPLCDPHSPLI